MSTPCPQEVIDTGRALIQARKLAEAMSGKIDEAIPLLEKAVAVMVNDGGAKAMQAGAAFVRLRQAQTAFGLIMEAHESLRRVLEECDVEQPTDAQVASIR